VGTTLLQSGLGFRAVSVDGVVRPYTVVLPRNYNPFKAVSRHHRFRRMAAQCWPHPLVPATRVCRRRPRHWHV